MEEATVLREIKNIDTYGSHYGHTAYCGNCGTRNSCYVRKGTRLSSGLSITCDKCGCGIRLRSQDRLWSEP